MKRMAFIDINARTVQLFEDINCLQEIVGEFSSYLYALDNKIIVSEDKILDVLKDTKNITIASYYDVNSDKYYDEISYDEWREMEDKSNKSVELKAYENLLEMLENSTDELLDAEDMDSIIENHYLTLGVSGINHNLILNADLYEEFKHFLEEMIKMEKELCEHHINRGARNE